MKGGNGVTNGSGITLCLKGEIPYCVSRKRPLDVARLGLLARTRNNLFRRKVR